MLPNERVLDLAADVLEAPSRVAAHDLVAGLDRLTAARVTAVLAVLVRSDRRGLRALVRRLRSKAVSSRDVSALEQLWSLPAVAPEGEEE